MPRLIKDTGALKTQTGHPRVEEWFVLDDGSELSLLVASDQEGGWNRDTPHQDSFDNVETVGDVLDLVGSEYHDDVIRLTRQAVHFYVDANPGMGLTLMAELAEAAKSEHRR